MASLPSEATREFTPEEVKALYPPDLTLQHVQVFFRHGERTPARMRLAEAGIPPLWDVCRAADEFRGTVLLPSGDFRSLHYRRRVETPESNSKLQNVGQKEKRSCLLGELTDQGRLSTLALGRRIRRLYVDQLKFLPQTLEDEKTLYIRTTHLQRTMESMIQVFRGLYPNDQARTVPNFNIRLVNHENLYPNDDYCAHLKKLTEDYSLKAAEEWDPKLKISSQVLKKWFPDGIKVVNRPKATGVLDTINSSISNGIPIPPEFLDERMLRDLESASVAEWFNGFLENQVYRRLGIGPLIGDVLDRFIYSTKNPWPQRMALYGTHDTTIAAMLATFGVFDNRWPRFTSNITFELFKAQQGGLLSFLGRNQYFVRMRYNQKVVSLPACKPPGKHREGDESLCTLEAFKAIVEKNRPSDWSKECRLIGMVSI